MAVSPSPATIIYCPVVKHISFIITHSLIITGFLLVQSTLI